MSGQSSRSGAGAVTSLEDPRHAARIAAGFRDRGDAGRRLGAALQRLGDERPIVAGIARGGVAVAAEVARSLAAPLEVAVVRKIGAPRNPEYAIGALAEGGVHVVSERVARSAGLSDPGLRALLDDAQRELDERVLRYRGGREAREITGRTVILVDDGLATGRSARAAVRSLRKRGAGRVILAVPVAAPAAAHALQDETDDLVCLQMPPDLWAVGQWYEDFAPTSDDQVAALLGEAWKEGSREPARPEPARPEPARPEPARDQLTIPLDSGASLSGELSVPSRPRGHVVFAHGSGSSRLSPRNRAVAQTLLDAGYATLLFDLLAASEESDRANVFDVPLLASRLTAATVWLRDRPEVAGLPVAYFGASTGAAAALSAASGLGREVRAVVSRGGRPDLAPDLGAVRAPTLLIVGGADPQVLALNREAERRLGGPSALAVVPGATHLFEEPGALAEVSRLAVGWLDRYLA